MGEDIDFGIFLITGFKCGIKPKIINHIGIDILWIRWIIETKNQGSQRTNMTARTTSSGNELRRESIANSAAFFLTQRIALFTSVTQTCFFRFSLFNADTQQNTWQMSEMSGFMIGDQIALLELLPKVIAEKAEPVDAESKAP